MKDLQIKGLPALSARNVETMYTDSGKVTMLVRTPLIQQFTAEDDPHTLFPEGLRVLFYDKMDTPQGSITAKYARFTEKDKEDLAFGLENGVDLVAISFVESASDITTVKNIIEELEPARKYIPIIAKLERPAAIKNLHEIVHAAEGVMVARGDLGVETSPALVPNVQKEIIRMANRHAKLVITATQMLESMIANPRPTRAEASDVANAVYDGTDAVMLSAETPTGIQFQRRYFSR